MPLDQTCSLSALDRNISRSYKDGKTAQGSQHVAIGLSVLKKACGVPVDAKMTPKEIVAAGQKEEGVLFRVAALVERGMESAAVSGVDPEVEWHKWVSELADQAELAAREAGRWKRGPATNALLKHLAMFQNRSIQVPTFEGREHPGSRAWTTWLARLESAARNGSLLALTKVLIEFRNGQVAVPVGKTDPFDSMMETEDSKKTKGPQGPPIGGLPHGWRVLSKEEAIWEPSGGPEFRIQRMGHDWIVTMNGKGVGEADLPPHANVVSGIGADPARFRYGFHAADAAVAIHKLRSK